MAAWHSLVGEVVIQWQVLVLLLYYLIVIVVVLVVQNFIFLFG